MNFISDNTLGAPPEILAALARANEGAQSSYGGDDVTARLTDKLSKLFEKDLAVFPVATGSAANSLALATLTPPHGAVICHEGAHIHTDECGAPEFFSGGAKLVPLKGAQGKLEPETIKTALRRFTRGDVHHVQPATISITQATEQGTSYTPAEIAAISHVAKAEGMSLHVDGARFANAIAFLKCAPAEAAWKAGVDAMSLGFTKNGALAAEAVIFFDRERVGDFEYRRKKGGHLLSKMRFISAQFEAMIDDGLWLRLAAHANGMAARLARGLESIAGLRLAYPVEANEVFASLPSKQAMKALEGAGAKFYVWEPIVDRPLIRLVCSFATREDDVDAFLAAARRLA